MFLTVRPPNGFVQSYNLSAWPAWSLELAMVRTGTQMNPTIGIAIVIRGPMNGAPLSVPLVVLNIGKPEEDAKEIRNLGSIQFNGSDKKERLREFLMVLNNNAVFKASEVEEIATNSGLLVDAANAFMSGLWSTRGTAMESLEPVARGSQLGWEWALTTTRFDPAVFAAPISLGEPPMAPPPEEGSGKPSNPKPPAPGKGKSKKG